MSGQSTDIVNHLSGVLFGFYETEEIRKMSVVEIKSLKTFDEFNNPTEEGLYDSRMGLSPYERNGRCPTCGQEEKNCIGHMGHIELVMPVYNCFLMNYLHKILRIKCFYCHNIKMTPSKLADYKILFTMIKLGLYEEFIRFKQLTESRIELRAKRSKAAMAKTLRTQNAQAAKRKSSSKSESTRRSSGELSDTDAPQDRNDLYKKEKILDDLYTEVAASLRKEKRDLKATLNVKNNPEKFKDGIISTFSTNQEFQELFKEFLRDGAAQVKCPHCEFQQPSVRKEGYAKFILCSLGEKTKMSKVLFSGVTSFQDEDSINQADKDGSEDEDLFLEPEDDESKSKKNSKKSKILHPFEVRENIRLLFEHNQSLLDVVLGNLICNPHTLENSKLGYEIIKFKPDSFFIEALAVSPNRFRPENKLSDNTYLHAHTTILQKILQLNYELKRMMVGSAAKNPGKPINNSLKASFSKWIELQETVNSLFDASKTGKLKAESEVCIKQLLEKKEGIFRMKIMGKRVNYAARSVISPDPMLDTNEVGVPLFMAKKLTFPEGVNEANYPKLKKLVINGANKWPGALYLEENGKTISLEGSNKEQREAIARSLLENAENKTVYRHMMNGDVLLFNRQPTLHKPSLMSHIARVLPSEQTIRMHYANCSGYNADFDGDEMNLHLLQSHLARAEAYNLSICDKQYILPRNRGPIRGLIQDIILSAVFLTMQNSFFEKSEYNQLVYSSLRTLIENENDIQKIRMLPPAIMKPRQLWTGKQVVSTIISIIAEGKNRIQRYQDRNNGKNQPSSTSISSEKLYMSGKTRVGGAHLSKINQEDARVLVQDNELLTGIIDKGAIGATSFGLVHCFYELTDSNRTGKLLSGLSRLFCGFLQMHGFTCGIDDLLTTPEFEQQRKDMLDGVYAAGAEELAQSLGQKDFKYNPRWDFFGRPSYSETPEERMKKTLKKKAGKDYLPSENSLSEAIKRKIIMEESGKGEIDGLVRGEISNKYNKINELAMSSGLAKKFPDNCFSVMVLSGAKGSTVNHNQISCMLGQQVLEGQRVPIMASGRTLPSFPAYDPNARAGGFVSDRFLTGLRPQEFFFHCMAGREGLIDTAVKTSRSGYLQRILVKNLESLIVQYDYSVRHNDGTIIQFLYGEDGLDSTKVNPIEKVNFVADNLDSFMLNSNSGEVKARLESKQAKSWRKHQRQDPASYAGRAILNELPPSLHFGAISEKAENRMREFFEKDPRFKKDASLKKKFKEFFYAKYFASLACPGEAVGAIAAQSFGEPSTQMTLNTFHLAGHGGANVTLGIPRLKELLVTRGTKTPSMNLYFKQKLNRAQAKAFARKITKVSLLDLVKGIQVQEQKVMLNEDKIPLPAHLRFRIYTISFQLEDLVAIKYAFGFSMEDIKRFLLKIFKPKMLKTLHRLLDKKQKIKGDADSNSGETARNLATYDLENMKMKKSSGGGFEGVTSSELPDASEYDDDNGENTDEMKKGSVKTTMDIVSEHIDGKMSKKRKFVMSESEASRGSILESFDFSDGECKIVLKFPIDTEKLLMVNIIEDLCKLAVVKEIPHIKTAHVVTSSTKKNYIQTEGVNFQACWNMPEIDTNLIECNDAHAICDAYGIEAARTALVNEVVAVFSVYGITVDYRHLYLAADYMTNNGYVNPMSRAGMQHNTSPLIKMSFETTMKFLTDACFFNQFDDLNTPSGRIVLGRNVQNGTGLFNVRQDLSSLVGGSGESS